tara:strand:- start:715 stop:1290 length:576 start_codon:yes stop_codon:yes gene_type:complete
MNLKFKSISLMVALVAITFTGCKKDDDDDHDHGHSDEGELITSVELSFIDSANISDTIIFAFRDPDGEGGNTPTVFDSIFLKKGTTYFMNISFLDESNPNDIEDITEEIKVEDDEHLICYDLTSLPSLSYTITDSDGQFPVGLESTWRTDLSQNIDNGSLKVTLKHQPGVKNGSCAPGDTDVEISFPTVIN